MLRPPYDIKNPEWRCFLILLCTHPHPSPALTQLPLLVAPLCYRHVQQSCAPRLLDRWSPTLAQEPGVHTTAIHQGGRVFSKMSCHLKKQGRHTFLFDLWTPPPPHPIVLDPFTLPWYNTPPL